jgi:hypothetical protein
MNYGDKSWIVTRNWAYAILRWRSQEEKACIRYIDNFSTIRRCQKRVDPMTELIQLTRPEVID